MHTGDGGFGTRWRTGIRGPSTLAVLGVAPVFWLLGNLGVIADAPLWTRVVVLLGAQFATITAYAAWPPPCDGWRRIARIGVHTFAIAAVIYDIGWGPTLAVGFLFGMAEDARISGSFEARAAIAWTVLAIGLGQGAIAVGFVPTLIPEPLVHGLALLSALGVAFSIGLLAWTMAQKDSAEDGLRRSDRRFRALVQHASDIILVLGPAGRLLYASPAFERELGYEPDEMLGQPAVALAHEEDIQRSRAALLAIGRGEDFSANLEVRLRAKGGGSRWFEASITNLLDDPDVGGVVANLRDITDRKAIAEQLAHAVLHDSLTGLPNRLLFVDHLDRALRRGMHSPTMVGVIFLDLDHFKVVNDSLGHLVGDELLRVIGRRLSDAVRPADTVARFGGDEFVVLCDDAASQLAVWEFASRVAERISQPVILAGREVFVSASIGIAISGRLDDSPDHLLQAADAAMYQAKDGGRARIEVFDEASRTRAVELVQTTADLHHALDREELRLHYQPIVALRSGRVSGYEALARWQHPKRGLLLPAEFITLAEETGLIAPIGAWILEEACRQSVTWRDRPGADEAIEMSMSINIAPRQLADPALVEHLAGALERTGIDPRVVCLELTEGSLMSDVESSRRALDVLRQQGVTLAVDDFGTGYSSLGHLKSFPVRSLKIDREFVDGLGVEPEATTIVRAVVELAHSLGMVAVAEGVETRQHLDELCAMGCDYAQGYLFGPPKPAEAIGDPTELSLDPECHPERWLPAPAR